MKRTVEQARLESGDSLHEGGKEMNFDAYKKMCELLFKGEGDDSIFSHTFSTLECNLLARSDNGFAMHVNHVEWRDNGLLLFLPNQRVTKLEKNSDHPWHV